MIDPEDLAAVSHLITERVELGFGSTLEVIQSGYIQRALHDAAKVRAQDAYDAYVASLVASQANTIKDGPEVKRDGE